VSDRTTTSTPGGPTPSGSGSDSDSDFESSSTPGTRKAAFKKGVYKKGKGARKGASKKGAYKKANNFTMDQNDFIVYHALHDKLTGPLPSRARREFIDLRSDSDDDETDATGSDDAIEAERGDNAPAPWADVEPVILRGTAWLHNVDVHLNARQMYIAGADGMLCDELMHAWANMLQRDHTNTINGLQHTCFFNYAATPGTLRGVQNDLIKLRGGHSIVQAHHQRGHFTTTYDMGQRGSRRMGSTFCRWRCAM
jgi:hypothetical protein